MKKMLSLILEEKLLKNLEKCAAREGISIEEYVIKVLKEFKNVKWRRKNYLINRKLYSEWDYGGFLLK